MDERNDKLLKQIEELEQQNNKLEVEKEQLQLAYNCLFNFFNVSLKCIKISDNEYQYSLNGYVIEKEIYNLLKKTLTY